jgi:hypothetical protein
MRAPTMIALTAVLVWLAIGELRAEPSAEPPADVTCRRDNGTGTYHASGGPAGTDIRITGAAGYSGDATVTFGSGAATPKMKFHFVRLRTLGTFTLTAGRHSFQGRLGWGATRTVAHFDKTGKPVASATLAALTMTMEATRMGDIEVRILVNRNIELGKEVRINWRQQEFEKRKGRGGAIPGG